MSLFGTYTAINTPKKKVTLVEICNLEFPNDSELQDVLKEYLVMRKKERNMPSSKSWTCQMRLLKQMPDYRRVGQVKRAIERGWRAVAYDNSDKQSNVVRKNMGVIVNESF